MAYGAWALVPAATFAALLPSPVPSWAGVDVSDLAGVSLTATLGSVSYVDSSARFAELMLGIWASGALLSLLWHFRSHRAFLRSLGETSAAADGTHRSTTVQGPLLVGLLRPKVILPMDFEAVYDPEERRMVLAHERAHASRGDLLANAVAAAWSCIFWFNPLTYWALSRFRFDQELACDATVLARGAAVPRRYAAALLKTQFTTISPTRTSPSCNWIEPPLKERIAMLNRPLPSAKRRLSGTLLVLALVASMGGGLWTALPKPSYAQTGGSRDEIRSLRHVIARNDGDGWQVTADRVAWLPNGDVELAGNVTVKAAGSDSGKIDLIADKITRREDGAFVLAGARIAFADGASLTTKRAVLDGETLRLDSARFSPPEKVPE